VLEAKQFPTVFDCVQLAKFYCDVLCADADMVKCAQSGFDEFVTKPLTVEKIVDRLKMIFSPSYDRKLDFMNTQRL
jgi:hypothetical protein